MSADTQAAEPAEPVDGEPFKTALITRWGREVTPENAWRAYPRPQLARENWQNLNGRWECAITSIERQDAPEDWPHQILVPFALESRLGGVQRLLAPEEALWYRRSFELEPAAGMRTLLHFEAVDYQCQVWINGKPVGTHRGGNTPFSFDVTGAVRPGANEVLVRVEDATEAWQLRGKQVLKPKGIWYTRISGIWQTVWLEQVPGTFVQDLHIDTDAATGAIRVAAKVHGDAATTALRVKVKDDDEAVATSDGPVDGLSITVPNAKLWTPDTPHLYTLEIELLDGAGAVLDHIASYAGIRTVGKVRDEAGHLRFTLNGETIFHWGPLDQGWWPDGLLTPPSDAAMQYDIEYLKSAGFNMIRKHIKVEPRRYYYHCDRLGMMIWQDQPSAGHGPAWKHMSPEPVDADWPDEHHQQYLLELESMIDTLENSPAVVVWVPFNEAWGQHRSVDVGAWVAKRDPSRLVNIASGGNFFPVGDIADNHAYPEPTFPFNPERFAEFIKVVGEFGGHGFPVEGHLWDPAQRNWGYGKLPESEEEYKARYRNSIKRLNALRHRGIAAGVYTQTTDVEIEINGLLTYDREVAKIPAEELAALHRELLPGLAGDTPSRTYSNPIIEAIGPADPHVIRHEGVYYLYPTDTGASYDVYTSPDLVEWEKKGPCFEDARGGLWAPDVFHHASGDGRFYLYYTIGSGPMHIKEIGVAVSDSPLGPFQDVRVLVEKAIDAHLFEDDDGMLYLYYVDVSKPNNIRVQPMKTPTKKRGESTPVIAPEASWECAHGSVAEGPWMLKHDGVYYLMYSGSGADGPDYAIGYATSKSPLGPFEKYAGNPIAKRGEGVFGPGHHSVVEGPAGDLWMVYHQKADTEIDWKRFLAIDPLWFEDGVIHTRTTRGTPQPAP